MKHSSNPIIELWRSWNDAFHDVFTYGLGCYSKLLGGIGDRQVVFIVLSDQVATLPNVITVRNYSTV